MCTQCTRQLLTQVPTRGCVTIPSEDEVRKAYEVLGATPTGSYSEAKKRFMDLAKQHHPDVASGNGAKTDSTMADLNNAYSIVSRFHKSGRTLSTHPSAGPSEFSSRYSGGGRHQNYYSSQDSAYQPWHEDIDPLMYEMMWEEMRRQNEEEGGRVAEGYYGFAEEDIPNGSYRPRRQHQPQHPRQQGHSNDGNKTTDNKPTKTTTWPEADLQALVNMYQDGKSFEFISNALGKDTANVLSEFNRWSNDNKSDRRQHKRNRRHRSYGMSPGPHYHAEFPDYPFAYDFPDFEDDDTDTSDPYGYHVGEEYAGDPYMGDGPVPYSGTHRMSGSRPGHGPAPRGNSRSYKRPYNNNRKWNDTSSGAKQKPNSYRR